MHLNRVHIILTVCLLSAFYSCKSETSTGIIQRFDIDIENFPQLDASDKENFKERYAPVIDLYINNIYPDSTISEDDKLDSFANSDAIKFFTPDVKKAFPDLTQLSEQYVKVTDSAWEKLGFRFPHVYAAIIPYNQSVILNDSTIIIGLNHYLGEDYAAYSNFPDYLRKYKIPEKIIYDITEAVLKTHYPFEAKSHYLLERMIYEGVIALAESDLIENCNECMVFSFTNDQLEWCKNNEQLIWNQLLIDDNLYSTSAMVQKSLLSPAPFAGYISKETPGLTGRWIGMHIVSKYLKNEQQTVKDVLDGKAYQDCQTFLIKAAYNGTFR